MEYKIVVLVLFYTVSSAQSNYNDDVEDRWSWGFVDEPVTQNKSEHLESTTATVPLTTDSSKYDPCVPYSPPRPSFKAPGRRINEEKCEEYIYDVNLSEELTRRSSECFFNNFKESGLPPPPAAVGGRDVHPGEFPHMGALGWLSIRGDYIFKCGSTLISPKFVMTAGHCIRAPPDTDIEDPEPRIVRLNDFNLFLNLNSGFLPASKDQNISRIIVHPDYHPPKKYNDIALMELEKEVRFTFNMRPACLWNRPDTGSFGNEVSLTGWGALAQGSLELSPILQAADVVIIDSKQCDELLEGARNRHWQGLTDSQLCAGLLKGGVDACQGDSGGPLQFRKPLLASTSGNIYYVIGVTSFGIGCALPNQPGIYTRVSSYIDWIESVVWK